MSCLPRGRFRTGLAMVAAAAAALPLALLGPTAQAAASPVPPPAAAGFDYQIGGGYTLPAGVTVVSRDHNDSPANGAYNICYINAFQTQDPSAAEDTPSSWPQDLLVHDGGSVLMDPDWNEALLDISTAANRTAIATRIEKHIDQCATKGFDALELDNYDSYTRSNGHLTDSQAQTYIKMLSAYGHGKGLAVAQKNTVELAPNRVANGLDFAIAEECGVQSPPECDQYIQYFGNHVIFIEYTDGGLDYDCQYNGQASIVERDTDVVTPGTSGYVRRTCPGGNGNDTQAPSTPTGLKATGATGSSVSLAWQASTDNVAVTGYDVYRGGQKVGTAAGTSYTDGGLTASTTYQYYVKARDAAGNTSAASDTVSKATTSGGGSGGLITSGLSVANGYSADYCLGVSGSGPKVALVPCDASSSQQRWTYDSAGQTIKNQGLCLDVAKRGTANGSLVEVYSCNGGSNQKWTYDSGKQQVVGVGSGRCLDDPAFATNGRQADIWDCNGGKNQMWVLP
ncbi:endo alpha-1,4 polygalactosaminidase [Streptomyces sp. NPDC047028]|uniref:endo alpha-1,4 polygalactosaminidase n=1 Tax=Streptomyces sp. NPDC047028 TaxID=3155793 RepID=UPI0033E623F4